MAWLTSSFPDVPLPRFYSVIPSQPPAAFTGIELDDPDACRRSAGGDFEMDQAGRITQPVILRSGSQRRKPISWSEAFEVIADTINALHFPGAVGRRIRWEFDPCAAAATSKATARWAYLRRCRSVF
ncbi:MAG TPA: hypothetical protein DDZ88_06530 [Verrucomicrobiales bacterium]|nr:hypothetical protein [Verrucomicrobiales bacterium]